MGRVSIDQITLRIVTNMIHKAAKRNGDNSLADAVDELEADANPIPEKAEIPADIPKERISEPCGEGIDELRPGEAYKKGWNDCVRKFYST